MWLNSVCLTVSLKVSYVGCMFELYTIGLVCHIRVHQWACSAEPLSHCWIRPATEQHETHFWWSLLKST